MAFGKSKKAGSSGEPGGLGERIFRERKHVMSFPWRNVDANLLAAVLECCTTHGAAIMFGGVQGGRGISITLFQDGDRAKEFCGTLIEFRQLGAEIIIGLQGTSEDYFTAYGLDRKALLNGDSSADQRAAD